MYPTTTSHTLPLFLSLFFLLCPAVYCEQTSPGNNTHLKNGQNGTPNLPVAPSRFVDWTHFGSSSNKAGSAGVKAFYNRKFNQELAGRLGDFFGETRKTKPDLEKLIAYDKQILALLPLIKTSEETRKYSPTELVLQSKSLYIGTEVRGGSGQTTYIFPSIDYNDAETGLELGADFAAEAGAYHVPNSFAVSIKGEITEQERALARSLNRIYAQSNKPSSQNSAAFQTISQFFTQPHSLDGSLPDPVVQAISTYEGVVHQDDISGVGTNNDLQSVVKLPNDYIHKTKEVIVSLVAGNRFFVNGSTLSDIGLTTSVLIAPFGEGRPGITLSCATQDFQSDPIHFTRSHAIRDGFALILQNRTPEHNPAYAKSLQELKANPEAFNGIIPAPLLPSWKFKFGLEYIAPVLGLTKTYAGFARYRDPNSYAEITLTYGEDGLGKDYGDISIGKSYTF